MKLLVNPHKIEIEKTPVNEKEINITKCEFEFADEITNDYVKEAYFTLNGSTYKQIIVNNECDIPYEVLNKKGQIEIGVVAYLVESEEEIKRYNPSPAYFSTWVGSLKEEFENSEPVTPSDKEQMEQALQDGLNDIAEAIDSASNLDIDVEKVDNKTTVTITKQDGTTKSEDILDGEKGDKGNDGYTPIKYIDYFTPEDIASLNIPANTSELNNDSGFITNAVNNLTNYTLKTSTGSLIDLEINGTTYVITLSLKDVDGNVISTDTIDLPLESVVVSGSFDSTNKKIVLTLQNGNTVDIPVGDLIAGLQTEITFQNKLASDLIDDTNSGNKFVSTSEKNTWNGKQDALTFDNTPTANSNNPVKSGGIKSYVDGLVGDINTVLDTINGEVI